MARRHRFPRSEESRPPTGVVVGDLQHWGHGWVAERLGWKPLRLGPEQRCHGFAISYPRKFAAVYAADGSVHLQVGRRAWDASRFERVEQIHDGLTTSTYALRLTDGAVEKIRLRMSPQIVVSRVIDPTYDAIDSQSDDVMKLFPYVADDGWVSSQRPMEEWVESVTALWTAGVRHSGRS